MRASQLPTGRRPDATAAHPRDRDARGPIVLGRYRLRRRLGVGGFGTVWWAYDERLDREVALKILPRERVLTGRFEREAHAAARLAHPGIVTLYEAAVDDEGAYLVSELVRGATLDHLLEAGQLSDRDIVTIGIALCEALGHAHAEGVVHRDVKPSNVLVPGRPASLFQVAKLTDFGVARVVGGDTLTRTGDVVGTAAYMAPEQAEGREAGAPADLYSLALVIYEALTGVNPLRTGTAAQRARRLGAHLPPLRRQRRDLPRELGQAIDQALRPRPRERGSLEHLREALASAAGRVGDEPGVVTGPLPTWTAGDEEQPRREDHPQPIEWPARAVAATAAAAIGAWISAHTVAWPAPPALVGIATWLMVAVLPRIGWLGLAVSTAMSLIVQARPGGALVILTGAAIPVLTMPRSGTAWPLPAVAPALGAVSLAGAWPALAGSARTAWRRAALGITGWTWILLAAPIANADIYARRLAAAPAPDAWMRSLPATASHVLVPLISSGAVAVALAWGGAALLLPLLRTQRSLALDAVLVTIWSALTAVVTGAVLSAAGAVMPGTTVVGAIAGWVVALAPTAFRSWRASRE